MYQELLTGLLNGDIRSLARCISLVENEAAGYESILEQLPGNNHTKVVGVTGPPGAGKSTLVNALITSLLEADKSVAIIAVDPSSPFNFGALLGDRIRMGQHFNHPKVFIRSMASRGALGGLSPKIIEVSDLVKAAGFDYLFIETVGVGQSEVEVAGVADTTVVVVVPEAGDEIQTMKAGLMEIADIFVVNKADREQADIFAKNLRLLAHTKHQPGGWEIPVIKSVAIQNTGITDIIHAVDAHHKAVTGQHQRQLILLADRAYQLIQHKRMKDINKQLLMSEIQQLLEQNSFNLYRYINESSCFTQRGKEGKEA
ncbi:LAO/AO transport system kinase [Chitinophaga terrae (ex Kim and Jung 2007)]|uniref:LAO/AO transport system kinase n=1 Tax=Chitinophaga terrae (ex Kim and Jung 2007) TaxID=408074 RepID=A0A1H4DUY6_9BACT|nr:methylmalonyl Co-A mutase-associated GTPase MeaB [Chitinophaga terrae (ex Kim and Jung 2007)]GEP91349.1 methylmalonyl Co-A mutase-associated GTPase MeaB [Chitinophaga terrae (ex Kim and Jung 2007)]SEA76407.1 LAO/AO transport system kinase [Chitinophaga terrae (ex Kim and Jung 2007)]